MKKTLYLAGPITEDPNARKSFSTAAKALEGCGYRVANPFAVKPDKLFKEFNNMTPGERDLAQLKADLVVMLTCDGVATMALNHSSPGTARELALAYSLSIPVAPVAAWMKRASKGGSHDDHE